MLLLTLGVAFQYSIWHLMVVATTGRSTLRATFCSHALMVWSKYVPGKIWSIIGRAGFLSRHTNSSLATLVGASTGAQVIMIVTGLACGLSFLALAGGHEAFLLEMRVGLIVLSVIGATVVLIGYLYRYVSDWKRSCSRLLLAVLTSVGAWLSWGVGLAHLLEAFALEGQYFRDIGSFAMAASTGILAVVSPGGLGVREGALSMLLSTHGMAVGGAALAAILARIWFVFGELLLFLAGLVLWKGRKQQSL